MQLGKTYNTRANSVAKQWSNEQRAAKLSTLASKQESVARKVISFYVIEKHRDLGKLFQSALGFNENSWRNGTPVPLTVIRHALQAVIEQHALADIQLYTEYLYCRDPITWQVLGDALGSAGSLENLCRPYTSEELDSLDGTVPLQAPASADNVGAAKSVTGTFETDSSQSFDCLLKDLADFIADCGRLGTDVANAAGALERGDLNLLRTLRLDFEQKLHSIDAIWARGVQLAERYQYDLGALPSQVEDVELLLKLFRREIEQNEAQRSAFDDTINTLEQIMCVRRSDGGVFPPLQVCQELLALTKAKLVSDPRFLEDDNVAAELKAASAFLELIGGTHSVQRGEDLSEIVGEHFGHKLAYAVLNKSLELEQPLQVKEKLSETRISAEKKQAKEIEHSPFLEITVLATVQGDSQDATLQRESHQDTNLGSDSKVQDETPVKLLSEVSSVPLVGADSAINNELPDGGSVFDGAQVFDGENLEKPASPSQFDVLPEDASLDLPPSAKWEDLLGESSKTIALSLLATDSVPYSSGACQRLIWNCVREGKLGIAYHLARAAERSFDNSRAGVPSILLRMLVTSVHVTSSSGPMIELLKDDLALLDSEVYSANTAEAEALRFLTLAVSMRAALLNPNSHASGHLQAVSLAFNDRPAVNRFVQVLVDYCTTAHNPLDPSALRYLTDDSRWKTDCMNLQSEADAWLRRAPHMQFAFQPAAKVWRNWLEQDGILQNLVSPIRAGKVDVAALKVIVERLGSDSRLRSEVDSTDRVTRGHKITGPIGAHAFQLLRKHVNEALSIASRWMVVVKAVPSREATYQAQQLRDLKDGLVRRSMPLRAELKRVRVASELDFRVRVSATCLIDHVDRLMDFINKGETLEADASQVPIVL